jgi:tetratricopeptide (TPR) repeat protein
VKQSAQQLRDEIVLREASLADARRELAAGELSAIEAASIEAREELALRRAREELEGMGDDGGRRSGRRRRRSLLWIGLGSFLIVIIIVLWSSIELRQAGTSITGNVSLGKQQEVSQYLNEAQSDVADGNVSAALSAYQEVLALSPKNASALTEVGWLDFSAGSSDTNPALVKYGIKELAKAIEDAPRNAAARLYYAIAAYSIPHNEAVAKSEFKVFLALHPTKEQLADAAPILKELGMSASS